MFPLQGKNRLDLPQPSGVGVASARLELVNGKIGIFISMQNMSPIPIALRIKAARIPVHWTVRVSTSPELLDADGETLYPEKKERVFWPQVEKTSWGDVELEEIEDPLLMRIRLLKLFHADRTEEAALQFLQTIGAWRVIQEEREESFAAGTYANITFGHRRLIGLRALPTTLDELLKETSHWYKLIGVKSREKLEAHYSQPPANSTRPWDRDWFAINASFANTLPVSLEWRGKDPYAVIETVSAWELMEAAAWADAVSRADEQVCAKCATRFTWPRKKKYCTWECGHLIAVQKYKRKRAALKAQKKKEITC
jgi:hypothetical protein